MKRLIFLLVFLMGFASVAQNEVLFDQANTAYADGDYEEAVKIYNQILENGQVSLAVHFNLGNAYYRLNEIAPSIYHYEKALQLSPGDNDVTNNLEFARTMTIDAIDEPAEEGLEDYLNSATSVLAPNGWAWLAISAMLLFVVFFCGYYFSLRAYPKKTFFIFGLVFLLFAITSVGVGFRKQYVTQNLTFAIVFSEEIEVRSEPNPRSTPVFTLHEGTKVKVTEDFQEWYEIELANGSQGWLKQNQVKKL